MKQQPKYMWYYKDYGCWIRTEGNCGKAMNPGNSFYLQLDKELRVLCHLRLDKEQLWYVELGQNKVKLRLRMNEVYEIED